MSARAPEPLRRDPEHDALSPPARLRLRAATSGASPEGALGYAPASSGGGMAVDTSQFRNGLKIELDGEPFVIVFFQHVKPGKGGAFVRTKVKNLKTGRVLDRRFRSGERVELAEVEDRRMQYLYQDGEQLVFMDGESFEQIPFTLEQVGDAKQYLKENVEVDVLFYKGRPINIELPAFVEAAVTQCEPGMKGDTASGATKPATIETGATIQVPLFIKEGEVIRVDTRSGQYVERVG
jgi:elongation factor P